MASHKFLVNYKKLIVIIFRFAHLVAFSIYPLGVYVFINDQELFFSFFEFGKQLGQVAFGLYSLTLIPGIFKRLNVFPIVRSSLALFRGQIGVLMFLTAIAHMGLSTTIPLVMTRTFSLKVLATREVIGLVAIWALLPLWITSNNLSRRKLGRWWQILHRLTYLALLLIFLHIALLGGALTFVALALVVAEVSSWVVYWLSKKKNAD